MKHSLKKRFSRPRSFSRDLSPEVQEHMLGVLEQAKDLLFEKWLEMTDSGTPAGELVAMFLENKGDVQISLVTVEYVPQMVPDELVDSILLDVNRTRSKGRLPVVFALVDECVIGVPFIEVEPMKLVIPADHRARVTAIIESKKGEISALLATNAAGTLPLVPVVSNGPDGIKLSTARLGELPALVADERAANVLTVAIESIADLLVPILYLEKAAGIVSIIQLATGTAQILRSVSSPGGQA